MRKAVKFVLFFGIALSLVGVVLPACVQKSDDNLARLEKKVDEVIVHLADARKENKEAADALQKEIGNLKKTLNQRMAARGEEGRTYTADEINKMIPATAFSIGSPDAPVTIVTFTEFLCPFCGRLDPIVHKLAKEYGPNKIRLVFQARIIHGEGADFIHRIAIAAGKQNKFWEVTQELFKTQGEWTKYLRPFDEQKAVDQVVKPLAQKLGLNLNKLVADANTEEVKAQAKAEDALGTKLGVGGTPTSFINGQIIRGAKPEEEFRKVIDEQLAKVNKS